MGQVVVLTESGGMDVDVKDMVSPGIVFDE